jgi:hypothetical protein
MGQADKSCGVRKHEHYFKGTSWDVLTFGLHRVVSTTSKNSTIQVRILRI